MERQSKSSLVKRVASLFMILIITFVPLDMFFSSAGDSYDANPFASAVHSFLASSSVTSGPAITTQRYLNLSSNTVNVEVYVTDIGSYAPVQVGVAYSSSYSTPTVNDSREYVTVSSTGYQTLTLSGLNPGTRYYARAYAIDSRGWDYVTYGGVIEFTTYTSAYLPIVYTNSVDMISGTSASVMTEVLNSSYYSGGYYQGYYSPIRQRGVVYSRNNSTPTLGGSDTQYNTVYAETGVAAVEIHGLSSYSTYYVRAFATNDYGTAYGSVLQISTGDYYDYSISTSSVTNITNNSAVAGGYNSNPYSSSFRERGVVYSASEQSPTISNSQSRVSSASSSYGNFTMDLTGLSANTRYYVRAYVRASDRYYYGNVVTFSTSSSASATPTPLPVSTSYVTVNLLFKTMDGALVGTQSVPVLYGGKITEANLNVPTGYNIVGSTYSYTANSNTSADVYVKKIKVEYAFMSSVGNGMFDPDRPITRIEVAKMIYSLRGSVSTAASRTFSDIPAGYAEAAAVNYVTAMGYMQGYPDGSFKPDQNITRAEVSLIAGLVYSLPMSSMKNNFNDIDGHWANAYVIIAANNNILSGYPDGSFKPDANMTRAEACSMFSRAENRNLSNSSGLQFFDVPPTHWAYKYIMNSVATY